MIGARVGLQGPACELSSDYIALIAGGHSWPNPGGQRWPWLQRAGGTSILRVASP